MSILISLSKNIFTSIGNSSGIKLYDASISIIPISPIRDILGLPFDKINILLVFFDKIFGNGIPIFCIDSFL